MPPKMIPGGLFQFGGLQRLSEEGKSLKMFSVSRTFSGEKDLRSMMDLLIGVRPADRIADFPSPADLREALALGEVQDNTRLWFDADDKIVGFAYVDPYHNLRFEFDQQVAPPSTFSEMVDWGVACIRRAMVERGETLTLDASCCDDDSERIALLEKHGFMMQVIRSLQLVCSLHEPIPIPNVPADFRIRQVQGEQDVKELVVLHRAAFGSEKMTTEERIVMMRMPEYDPELDLLAIAPDSRFAAYCICSIHQEERERTGKNEGYADIIATHPDFQRRGLARSLLLTGLHKLKQRGIDTAVLGTSSENVAMLLTAQSTSFRLKSTTYWFAKSVL